MKLGWFDSANFDNGYCGKDGGSYIRIPLLRELNRRGWQIDFEGYNPDNYDYTEEPLKQLDIIDQAIRFRSGIPFVNETTLTDRYDAVIVEARSSDFDEFDRQLEIIDAHDNVYVLDRNNWARDIPADLRDIHLLRPYIESNDAFDVQTWFPYWRDERVPVPTTHPEYDLVYVGNRWGREDEMREFLELSDGLDMLIAGNWPEREPDLVDEFDDIDWLGPVPHYSVVPLLGMGAATFHVGKPDYNPLGFLTMRTWEARMAGRCCFHTAELEYADQHLHNIFVFEHPRDIQAALDESDPYDLSLQYQNQPLINRHQQTAADQLEAII